MPGSDALVDAPADAPLAPVTITVTSYKDLLQQNAAVVAYQDGSGSWTAATGGGGLYTFDITGSRYAVAWVCSSSATARVVHAYYLTRTDATRFVADCGASTTPYHVTGAVSGLTTGQSVNIQFGSISNTPASFGSATYDIDAIQSPMDIVLSVKTNGDFVKFLRQSTLLSATMNFNLANGFLPESHTGSVTNAAPGETLEFDGHWLTKYGTAVLLGGAGTAFSTIPAADIMTSDVQFVTAIGLSSTGYRTATIWGTTLADSAFTLPPFIGTVDASATARHSIHASVPAAAGDYYTLDVRQTVSGGSPLSANDFVSVSSGWVGSAANVALDVPDLSAFSGWLTGWNNVAGTAIDWTVSQQTNNHGFAAIVPSIAPGTLTPDSFATQTATSTSAGSSLIP
jgi:hypothetical protein